MAATDPEQRAIGEIPPERQSVPSFAELETLAASEKGKQYWRDAAARARRERIRVPGEVVAYYRRASTVFHHILPEGRLRLSSFDLMRDPRENKDWVTMASVTRGGTAGSA